MLGDGQLRSDWNKALLQDIISKCWSRMIVKAVKNMSLDAYHSIWPVSVPPDAWKPLLISSLLNNLSSEKVLFSSAGEGKWCNFNEAVLLPLSISNPMFSQADKLAQILIDVSVDKRSIIHINLS
jgi:hypothetical protein